MMEFGEYARVLERSQKELHTLLVKNLWQIGLHQQVLAAELIGHELPQWPALSDYTVEEKTKLGYVGHVSATDPLLRTGEMRDSIEVEVEPWELTEVTGSKSLVYLWMEMGTKSNPRGVPVPPRPSLAIAAIGSLEYAGEKLTETAVYALTGLPIKIATELPPGLVKR